MAAPAPVPAAAPAAAATGPATPTFKVFVGNLSFKTREGELQKAFSGAGNVLSANIITRGPRSLGYGFVEFATEAEANKSVTLMNKKELDGREINVEVAKNREDVPAPAGGEGFRGRGRGGGGVGGAGGAGATRGGFLRRRGAPAGGAPAAAGGADAVVNGAAAGGFQPRGRGGFRGGRGGARGGAAGGAAPAAAGGAPRPPRVDRAEAASPSVPRTQSATTLFVANLPFAVDDKGLQEIFQGFNPSAAHVVTKRNGRSKGFGFVEFKNADDQQKALAAVEKKQVQGRELIVKVALTDQVHHEGKADSPAPAAAAAVAAPAAAAEKK